MHNGSANCNPLLLPTRDLARTTGHHRGEIQSLCNRLSLSQRFWTRHTLHQQWKRYIVEN